MHQFRILIFLFSTCISYLGLSQGDLDLTKDLLNEAYLNDLVNYESLKEIHDIVNIRAELQNYNLKSKSKEELTAFYINAYNAIVLLDILDAFPLASVEKIPDFFTRPHAFNNQNLSLNEIENLIHELSKSADFHLVLNCGAKSCPKAQYFDSLGIGYNIQNLASENLRKPHIININEADKIIELNKIFFWNKEDFYNDCGSVKLYLEKFFKRSFKDFRVKYMEYDWSLNNVGNNKTEDQKRFYPVKIYRRGALEIKFFNNYYSQSDLQSNLKRFRTSFYSSFLQVLFGSDKNYNLGFDLKFRSVERLDENGPLFHALSLRDIQKKDGSAYARAGLSYVGLRIKYQPFKDKPNINFLHSVYISTMGDAEGNDQYDWVDFDGVQIYNQMYFEKMTGPRSNFFMDAGIFIEGLKTEIFKDGGAFTQISLPFALIWSYYPTHKMTLYGLIGVGPKFGLDNRSGNLNFNLDAYAQLGPGFKYFITDLIEVELLYTQFLTTIEGQRAASYNLGIRYKY